MISGQDTECYRSFVEDQVREGVFVDSSNESNERNLLLHHRPSSRHHHLHNCSSRSDVFASIPNKTQPAVTSSPAASLRQTSKAKPFSKCSAFLSLLAVTLLATIFGFFFTSRVLKFDIKSKLQPLEIGQQKRQNQQQQQQKEREKVKQDKNSSNQNMQEKRKTNNRDPPTKTNIQHSSNLNATTASFRDDLPNYYKPVNPPDFIRHWSLKLSSVDSSGNSGGGVNQIDINCTINVMPEALSSSLPNSISISPHQPTSTERSEQYLIHVHGLHHTGTGFLRQSIYNALNSWNSLDEFIDGNSHDVGGDNDMNNLDYENHDYTPLATMHDSLLPYKQRYPILQRTRDEIMEEYKLSKKYGDRKNSTLAKYRRFKTLYDKYHVPEEEGQHFQNIYPSFLHRSKEFKRIKVPFGLAGKLAYMADYCQVEPNNNHGSDNQNENVIGDFLLKEWSRYWANYTTTPFLIQKTPTLDVGFLESVKTVPTLHVIIVRHPMTSNSWGIHYMGNAWLDAFEHTLGLMAEGDDHFNEQGEGSKIEWYAVVTYEALVQNREEVMEELIEVIRSGVNRFRDGAGIGGTRKNRKTRRRRDERESKSLTNHVSMTSKNVNAPAKKNLNYGRRKHPQQNRKLHLRSSNDTASYLIPKEKSILTWKGCLAKVDCRSVLEKLTKNILPYFGYASMKTDGTIDSSLSLTPGPVMVSKEFAHVLFSSESDSLKNLMQSKNVESSAEYIGGSPPKEMLHQMKELINNQPISAVPAPSSVSDLPNEYEEGQLWKLIISEKGQSVQCHITLPAKSSANNATNYSTENQCMIHVHGLHHTGTGFARKLIHDALNERHPQSASVQDSLLPYRESGFDYAKIYNQYHVSEDEGQHFQTVYPSFKYRVREFKRTKSAMDNAGNLVYMADLCTMEVTDSTSSNPRKKNIANNQVIGNYLLQQWMPYWNSSSPYLVQKTPTLDVAFLDSVKVMPTFHLIIVRHPLTSNSFGVTRAAWVWLDAWTHTLEMLADGKIEWFAVVTYESLVQYQDRLVEELMEVIDSGRAKYGRLRQNRQLHVHSGIAQNDDSDLSTLSYLVPKERSIELWLKCLDNVKCRSLVDDLTSSVFPYFGYTSVDDVLIEKDDEELEVDLGEEGGGGDFEESSDEDRGDDKRNAKQRRRKLLLDLTSSPGPVGVAKEFGHVLFSSEGTVLQKFRANKSEGNDIDEEFVARNYLGDLPPTELLQRMKGLMKKHAR